MCPDFYQAWILLCLLLLQSQTTNTLINRSTRFHDEADAGLYGGLGLNSNRSAPGNEQQLAAADSGRPAGVSSGLIAAATGQFTGWEESGLWEPYRQQKSIHFLGKEEETGEPEAEGRLPDPPRDSPDRNLVDNTVDDKPEEKSEKKPKLNVSSKDSPYALIDKYFPERESYFYQNKNTFKKQYEKGSRVDIGDLEPNEVWLVDESLLVLKGGSTPDRDGFDMPWQPLDNFQAPYREPVLPPPDFDPDSLELGVGLPIEEIVAQLQAEKAARSKHSTTIRNFHHTPTTTPSSVTATSAVATALVSGRTPGPQDVVHVSTLRSRVEGTIAPFRAEVVRSHDEEYNAFMEDVNQFISEMENFHAERKLTAKNRNSARRKPPQDAGGRHPDLNGGRNPDIDVRHQAINQATHREPQIEPEQKEKPPVVSQLAPRRLLVKSRVRGSLPKGDPRSGGLVLRPRSRPSNAANEVEVDGISSGRLTGQRSMHNGKEEPGDSAVVTESTSKGAVRHPTTLTSLLRHKFASDNQNKNYPPAPEHSHTTTYSTPVVDPRWSHGSPWPSSHSTPASTPTPRQRSTTTIPSTTSSPSHSTNLEPSIQYRSNEKPPAIRFENENNEINEIIPEDKPVNFDSLPQGGNHPRASGVGAAAPDPHAGRQYPGFSIDQNINAIQDEVEKTWKELALISSPTPLAVISSTTPVPLAAVPTTTQAPDTPSPLSYSYKTQYGGSPDSAPAQPGWSPIPRTPSPPPAATAPRSRSQTPAGWNRWSDLTAEEREDRGLNTYHSQPRQEASPAFSQPVSLPNPQYSQFVPILGPGSGPASSTGSGSAHQRAGPQPAQRSGLPAQRPQHHQQNTTPAPEVEWTEKPGSGATPLSIFQSLPENIDENSVFNLSKYLQFGSRLPASGGGQPSNEVDTGNALQSLFNIAPINNNQHRNKPLGRNRVTNRNKKRNRRPPSSVEQTPASDRQGAGDVRYVSFYGGILGGRSWGYSYQLG